MRKIISWIFSILIILLISNSQTASAIVITIEVTGIVKSVTTEGGFALDGSVDIGTTMNGFCVYDSCTPDLYDSPANGSYQMISISMAVGNYVFTHNPISSESPLFNVYTVDPGYRAISGDPRFEGVIYVDGTPKTYGDIAWDPWCLLELMNVWTSSGGYIPDDSLPTSLPDISVFDFRKIFETRFHAEGNDYFGISGKLTSMTAIPEPATLLLLGLGGLGLIRKSRK